MRIEFEYDSVEDIANDPCRALRYIWQLEDDVAKLKHKSRLFRTNQAQTIGELARANEALSVIPDLLNNINEVTIEIVENFYKEDKNATPLD